MDKYTICLLGWFFGMLPGEVEKRTWTQEDIDKAQDYCEKKHADPIEYWKEEW